VDIPRTTRTLSQEDIDALFGVAQGGSQVSGPKQKVEDLDLRKSSPLSTEQVRVVTALYESLARRLGDSLGAYLRVGFEMDLVSAERLTFAEFLVGVPELTYSASFQTLPIDAPVLIQVDLSLAFPIVDLVLGGSGSDTTEPRELTEIEEDIFEAVVALIARDLEISWAPIVELKIKFEQRQPFAQLQNLMLPNEKILSLNFDARIPNVRGAINIVFSGLIANALLHKLSLQGSAIKRTPSRDMRRRIRERLLGSTFRAELDLPSSPISVRQILEIKEEQVLVLPNRASDPIQLKIAGTPMFAAYPVRQGSRKSARIEQKGWSANEPPGKDEP